MEGSQESPSQPPAGEPSGRGPHSGTAKTRLQKIKDKVLPGVKIGLLISLIFYIAMLVVGIWGSRKCPVEPYIPFFLIVIGIVGLLSKPISASRSSLLKRFPAQYLEFSLYTVELVFLLFGSYWVFKTYKPHFGPPDSSQYCDKTVYMFAFIYLAVQYALLIIMLAYFLCFLGCIFFVSATLNTNDDPESPTRPIHVPSSDNEQQE